MKYLLALCALYLIIASIAGASGIFTLRGRLKAFDETTYTVETKAIVYVINKSGLTPQQIAELKSKKSGHDVDLIVSTEAVAAARDAK